MNFKLSITGHDVVDNVLRSMPQELSHKVLGSAHAKAAQPMIPAAQSHIRSKTGNLRGSIGTEKIAFKKTSELGLVYVGPRRRRGYKGMHGHMVEFGHDVKRKKGGDVLGYAKPYPFMEPAFNQTKSIVENNIKEELVRKLAGFMKRFIGKTGGTWQK